jgi:hypothetical protein
MGKVILQCKPGARAGLPSAQVAADVLRQIIGGFILAYASPHELASDLRGILEAHLQQITSAYEYLHSASGLRLGTVHCDRQRCLVGLVGRVHID